MRSPTKWAPRFVAAAVVLASTMGAGPAEDFDAQVHKSIAAGANFLLTHKSGAGWEGEHYTTGGGQVGGETGLALHALLHAGKVVDDPRLSPGSPELKSASDYLATVVAASTYAGAYQAMAFADLPKTPANRAVLERALKFLLTTIQPDGGYAYSANRKAQPLPHGWWDNSNSQIAVLGVWSAADAGLEVPFGYWEKSEGHWLRTQDASGGWCYYIEPPTTKKPNETWGKVSPAMSAAGVASLFITKEHTSLSAELDPKPDKKLEAGIAYLEKTFSTQGWTNLYYLYGCERVGLAGGLKYFKGVDWYHEGAKQIMAAQQPDGGWNGGVAGTHSRAADTAYALLFLSRGQNPVAFNKLKYNGPWDARLLDDSNLAHWITRQFESPVNWQVVGLDAPPEGWMDAPVLLITGHGDPGFTPEDVKRFRAYVDAGGLIFSTADGDDKAFTTAVAAAAGQMVDEKYEMRDLPKDHYVFNTQLKADKPVPMLGLSNGVRELWVHSPTDMGARWQKHAVAETPYFQVPTNIYYYAIGRDVPKGRVRLAAPKPAGKPGVTFHVARIRYGGNWDPEPTAWARASAFLQAEAKIAVGATPRTPAELNAGQEKVAHLTGTTRFTLPADDTAKIKAFIDQGGTLLADAAGGSPAFVDSFARWSKTLYAGENLTAIPADDPLFKNATGGAAPLDKVRYRRFYIVQNGRANGPRLLGLKHQGRWAVVFSPDDLTGGLAGLSTWGISGPTPESARALVRNVLATAQGK